MTVVLNSLPGEQIDRLLSALEKHISVTRNHLEEIAPLTWEMVERMHGDGITIGSHTMSHRLLTSESIETARQELLGSKLELESRLKAPVHHFAYPDGRFNPDVVAAVHAADYRYAYGICQTRDPKFPLLTIPRKVLWERSCLNVLGRFSPSIMHCHSQWVFDSNLRCEHDHREKHGTLA
jgi:peptidoglycan/xylan/chitin deacetylase (PgdA/CDA1 family)